jgi:uncharacterized membrane-anchored protein
MNKKLLLFVVFVGLQLLVIGGFFAQRLFTLSTGAQVVLRTVPIDPRDLIRGEYVALRYEISTINQYMAYDQSFKVGDPIYVTLEKNSYDDMWHAASVSKTAPTDYSIAIKGKVTSIPSADNDVWNTRMKNIGVEYGIERYFVKVDRSGASVIERVEEMDSSLIDDESVPVVSPDAQASSANVRSQLAGLSPLMKAYYNTAKDYGTPYAAALCPASGGSIFFKNARIRESIAALRTNAVSGTVRCASGAQGTAFGASSWAVSATLRSGGTLCISSANTTRAGVASGGGVQPAVCR